MISWFRIRTADIRIALHLLLSQFPPYSCSTTINKQYIWAILQFQLSNLQCSYKYRACLVSSRQQTLDRPYLYSFIPTLPSQQANQASCIIQWQKCTYLLSEVDLSRLASRSRVLKSVSRLTTTQSTKSVDGTPSQSIIVSYAQLLTSRTTSALGRYGIGHKLLSSASSFNSI